MLTRPILRPLMRPILRVATAWDRSDNLDAQVAALFANGEQGAWYDPSDMSTLFQDAGVTPVTAVAQPIGRILDKSGRGNHANQATTTSRALWQGSYAQFDGIDDSWSTAAIDFTSTDKVTVIAGVQKLSDAATGMISELSVNADSNVGAWLLAGPVGAGANYRIQTGPTGARVYTSYTPFAAPLKNVLTVALDNNAAPANQTALRVDGILRSGTTTINGGAAGAFGNYPLLIGRRGGTTFPFNGNLYGLIIVGRLLTATELAAAERYMASKAGVVLP